ncbi:MAG: hypothetical protein JW892_03480 [Anaerolineae bacterium]|nr:hypothetical protein [Anaerolineae bacterium]
MEKRSSLSMVIYLCLWLQWRLLALSVYDVSGETTGEDIRGILRIGFAIALGVVMLTLLRPQIRDRFELQLPWKIGAAPLFRIICLGGILYEGVCVAITINVLLSECESLLTPCFWQSRDLWLLLGSLGGVMIFACGLLSTYWGERNPGNTHQQGVSKHVSGR